MVKIIDTLRSLLLQKKKVTRSLESAISAVLERLDAPNRVGEIPIEDVVRNVTDITDISVESIMTEATALLGLQFVSEPQVPTRELLKKVGHKSDILRKLDIIPENTAFGYRLIVANPSLININDYHRLGVTISVSLASCIAKAWSAFDEIESSEASIPNENRVLEGIQQLCEHAHMLNAKEVFIGVPGSGNYEFVNGSKQFRGKLNKGVFLRLHKIAVKSSDISWPIHTKNISNISITLMHCGVVPVIYLTWECNQRTAKVEEPPTICLVKNSDNSEVDADEKAAQSFNQHKVRKEKIYLADDDPCFITVAKRLLSDNGYEVVTFTSGKALIKQVRESDYLPGVIVCDLHMPQINGTQVLRLLRAEGFQIPFLALTSDHNNTLQEEVAKLGGDMFLNKQESPKVLLAWVKNCTQRNTNNQNDCCDIPEISAVGAYR